MPGIIFVHFYVCLCKLVKGEWDFIVPIETLFQVGFLFTRMTNWFRMFFNEPTFLHPAFSYIKLSCVLVLDDFHLSCSGYEISTSSKLKPKCCMVHYYA